MKATGPPLTRVRGKTFKFAFALGFLLALMCLIPAYRFAIRAPGIGAYLDDGVYLVTAKALATGHGYRIISLPSELPQTKYPILFPLILSAVWRLDPHFPENALLLKLIPFTFTLLWLWLSYRLCKQEQMPDIASGMVILLTATLPWVIDLGSTLLSEALFATLCTGALMMIRRLEEGSTKRWELASAAILASLACLTRAAGICVILTGLFILVRRRAVGKALQYLSITLLVYGPWPLWVVLQHPAARDPYYSDTNYRAWNILFNFTWSQKFSMLLINGALLLASPLQLLGFVSPWAVVAGGVMVIAALLTWQRVTAIHAFVILYVLLILFWAWPATRFAVVIFPVVLLLAWQAARFGCERFKVNSWIVCSAAFLMLGLLCARSVLSLMREKERSAISEISWRRTEDLLGWIRHNTPADAVLLGNLDPMFYLYTDRHAVRGFEADPFQLFYAPNGGNHPLGTVDDFRNTILRSNVRYIIRMPNADFAEAPYLDRLLAEFAAQPGAADLVKENGRDSEFMIYRVNQAALDTRSRARNFSDYGPR